MTPSCLQKPVPPEKLTCYQIPLPEQGVAFVSSGPQHLWFDPEETLPGRFHANDAGLFLITAHTSASADVPTQPPSHFDNSGLLLISTDSSAPGDHRLLI